MFKIGIVGYGSIGSMLVNGFIKSKVVQQQDIIVSTRTKSKLKFITEKYESINISETNKDVINNAKHVFICVKPFDVLDIIKENIDYISEETHIISTNSFVSIENIEKLTDGKVTKISPSITSKVGEGITLLCHNENVNNSERNFIEFLLGEISKVKIIQEKDFIVVDKFTSCGPGFIAKLLKDFINAGSKKVKNISKRDFEEMILYTFLGTAKLISEEKISFDDVISKVATKGGITEEGINVLDSNLIQIYDRLINNTIVKSKNISHLVNKN